MLTRLDEMETADGPAMSLYLPPGLPTVEIDNLLAQVLHAPAVPPGLVGPAAASATGAILFWGKLHRHLILPPFPIADRALSPGYDVEPLRSLLGRDFTVALVLVRLGAYAVGICRGEQLINSKVGTGLIHARHKKGGSSQRRFERHRENQIAHFLKRVCRHVREHLEPQARALDYLVYGGARTTILSLRQQCPYLHPFDNRTLPPLLDIPEPRQAVLEAAVGRVWSSSITEWYDDEGSQPGR